MSKFLSVSAFDVGLTSSLTELNITKIPLKSIKITATNTPCNSSTSLFSVLQSSLYWFQLSAGAPANTKTDYRLNGLNYPAAVYSSVAAYPQSQLTKDYLK